MSAPPGDQRHSPMWKANYNNFVNMDGARHLMLRREQMPFFTPKYLNALKDRIRAEIARLLDALPVEGECDFVEHFSQYLPVFTICEILGIPQADRSKFFGWLHYLELAFHWMSNDPPAPGTPEAAEAERFAQAFTESTAEMFAYGRDTLHKRRQSPKDDLMSAIALSKMDGEFLRDEYLDGAWLAIVFAGNDTTRNTITGSINLLTEFPDQKAKLIANPNLTANAVEEFLRLVSPIIYMRRTATKEVELHGQKIHEGEKVLMYYASANRDEAVFANPDRLDIARENAAKQIAFGVGPHVCMGRRLAQLQLELFHEQIWRRYPDLQYVGGMEVAANNFAHCINKLPVRYSAGRKAA
ncbi:MAG: cytochrome P450 [Hyphomonadaceae bacterium]